MFHFPRLAIAWNLLWLLIGAFISMSPRLIWNIPYIFEFYDRHSLWTVFKICVLYHMRTDQHIVSYVFGIFCAYLIKTRPKAYLGGRVGELVIWLLTWGTTLLSQYWFAHFWITDYHISYVESLTFLALGRILYLNGYFWLIYACATGRGGQCFSSAS